MDALLLLLIIPLAVAAITIHQVRMMSHPERMLKRDNTALEAMFPRLDEAVRSWILRHGCEFVGSYKFLQTMFTVWKIPQRETHLVVYLNRGRVLFDFETSTGPNQGLTTTNSDSAFMFPMQPGNYKESIVTTSLDKLYEAHLRSLDCLKTKLGVREAHRAKPFEDDLLDSMRSQMTYVRSLPGWPLRAIYWYFVKRARMRGKTIEDQLRLGLISR